MDIIKELSGRTVRRMVFSLKKPSGEYYHIFTVFEAVEPWMQDFEAFPAQGNSNEYNDRVENADGSTDKVFFTVDRFELTDDVIRTPWDDYKSGPQVFHTETRDFVWPVALDACQLMPSIMADDSELASLLPRRECPSHACYCIPRFLPSYLKMFLENEKVKRQLTILSERNLGYDLLTHTNFLGAFVFQAYVPVYRQISFTEANSRKGVFCRVDYLPGKYSPLSLNITCWSRSGGMIGSKCFHLDGKQCLNELDLGVEFDRLEIDVKDEKDQLIDFCKKLSFVHSILTEIQIVDREVHIQDENEGNMCRISKSISAERVVVGDQERGGLLDSSPEYSYKKFEKALDFVFFDGDKDNIEENLKKSDECILRILDSAHSGVFICDVFFDAKSLKRFVLPMKSRTVPVRVLSGKAELKGENRGMVLQSSIHELNEKGISNISCRLLTGKSALHDRLIIADDRVWMLGCSLNQFGERATTLIRVPKEYQSKLIDRVEQWWSNDNLSVNLESVNYANNNKPQCRLRKWLNKLCGR